MHLSRVKKLREIFVKNNIDALLVTKPQNIFYLSSFSQFSMPFDGYLFVTNEKNYLFTSALYAGGIEKTDDFELCVISKKNRLVDFINDIVRHEKIKRVGLEGDFVSYSFFENIKDNLLASVDSKSLVDNLRVVKEEEEMHSIEKACALTDKTYRHVLKKAKQGMTERQIAFEIEMFIRKEGGELAFPSIVAFGENAAVPHHENSDKKLSNEDCVVLLDLGAKIDGYSSDLSRTFFVGTPSEALSSTYDSLLKIQSETIDFAKKQKQGSKIAEIAEFCDNRFEDEKLPPLSHSLGHGLGIDIHEGPSVSPGSKNKLNDGVVFTIEPGVYVLGKFGMRIEDTVGVMQGGLRVFTKSGKENVVISL